jgi:hypothetical protein
VVRGRRLNLSRRRLIAQLRAHGWTLARIANRLGITRDHKNFQHVNRLAFSSDGKNFLAATFYAGSTSCSKE